MQSRVNILGMVLVLGLCRFIWYMYLPVVIIFWLFLTAEETGSRIYQEPFCHCVLPNFLQELDELENLEAELSSLKFKEKNNDLYKFYQVSTCKKILSEMINESSEIYII